MIVDSISDAKVVIDAIYRAIPKSGNFRAYAYKWRLGEAICRGIKAELANYVEPEEDLTQKITLYGIEVEPNIVNPMSIELFEDVTTKNSALAIIRALNNVRAKEIIERGTNNDR